MTKEQHVATSPGLASARQHVTRAGVGDARALLRIFSRVCGSYTRGVLVESIVVGIIAGVGLSLIGVEAWLPLGVIALVGEIVPIIGPWIALVVSLPVILATQPDKAVLALVLFMVIQILDWWVLAPRIQGRSVRFPSFATLIIMAVGGVIAGPLGAILALPAAALLRDISAYTSYRAGGLSPSAALGNLPSFQREQARLAPMPAEATLPPP